MARRVLVQHPYGAPDARVVVRAIPGGGSLLRARRDPTTLLADQHVVAASHTDRQSTLLVRTDARIHDPAWPVGRLSLEDLVLAYMGHAVADDNHRPALEVVR
jgi:ABC-2 type transport system ATP-binding protein